MSCKLPDMPFLFQLKHDTVVAKLIKSFRDIKENKPNLIAAIKGIPNFMS